MDTLRVPAGVRKADEQCEDLRAWLRENNRIPRDNGEGRFDAKDCTVTSHTPGHETDDDVSLVRDTENNRVHYSVMPDLFKYERRFVQLDHEPTPFPESLAEWRVGA